MFCSCMKKNGDFLYLSVLRIFLPDHFYQIHAATILTFSTFIMRANFENIIKKENNAKLGVIFT